MTRSKFRCVSVTNLERGGEVKLKTLISGSEDNSWFFNMTTNGEINLETIDQDVIKQFIPGMDFYVDFTSAD